MGDQRNLLIHSLFWGFSDTAPRSALFYKTLKEADDTDAFLRLTEHELEALVGQIGDASGHG
jgi:hypothetical protein